MKLWEITNGYIGYSHVRVYVIASTEQRALELASKKYKESATTDKGPRYPEAYWTNLKATCMCEDVSKEYVSEPED